MPKDLPSSPADRQAILNNDMALYEIQQALNLKCITWNDQLYLTEDMAASFFGTDVRTIERYIGKYGSELEDNGYITLEGEDQESFLRAYENSFAADINAVRKSSALNVFDFRSFLDLAMLLAENETAFELRQIILDIVIDTINQKIGGSTKYIGQRDQDFLAAFLQEEDHQRTFIEALRDHTDMGTAKYALCTAKVCQIIFKEKAREYRRILRRSRHDARNDEISTVVSSYEDSLASMIKDRAEQAGRKLNSCELSELFAAAETSLTRQMPIIAARTKTADSASSPKSTPLHQHKSYTEPFESAEHDSFSDSAEDVLARLMAENQDVLKRLKESI